MLTNLNIAVSSENTEAKTYPTNGACTLGIDLDKRSSGVLLHISSLPSQHGIGDLGDAARRFADYLRVSGQRYWQMLPLNPSNPSSGESPYFSSSAFAGNPLLIDLIALQKDGLLDQADLEDLPNFCETEVDHAKVRSYKLPLLNKAAQRFLSRGDLNAYKAFVNSHSSWLEDFVLFIALQSSQNTSSWSEWPAALRDRETNAIETAKQALANTIELEKVLQFFFYQQWHALRQYCNDLGLITFGDMPIYVSYESADVWVNSQFFKLDDYKKPTVVSGVPPDFYSATGQLWNNPVYNWEELKKNNYSWWIERMRGLFELFDIVRIDHFRGLIEYWEVPASENTAINGSWHKAPCFEFFDALSNAFDNFPVVVEDLGIITEDIIEVKDHYQFPGMVILQFAFDDPNPQNPYIIENHQKNSLAYIGSHDNSPCLSWYNNLSEHAKGNVLAKIVSYTNDEELVDKLIAMLFSSKAGIAITTAQDLIYLDDRGRMNDPAFNTGNWRWKLSQAEFEELLNSKLATFTKESNRWFDND